MSKKQQFPNLVELVQAVIIDNVSSIKKIMHKHNLNWSDIKKMTNPQTKQTIESMARDFDSNNILTYINNDTINNIDNQGNIPKL